MLDAILSPLHYFLEARAFLRQTIGPTDARRIIEEQYAQRETTFLELMERVVYANPQNPYYRLLSHAGIDLEEVKRLVAHDGLESALEQLHDRGVYVTQAEFKGRAPVRRSGLEFKTSVADFDNPLAGEAVLESRSSGSTGAPLRVGVALDRIGFRAAETLLIENAGALGRPLGTWKDASLKSFLRYAKVGLRLEKHFTTVGFRRSREGLRYIVLLNATLLATRLAGSSLPRPEVVRVNEAVKIARWLARKSAAKTPAVLQCHVAGAVRICIAAKEEELDLSGTLFLISGEPYTPVKASLLQELGASAMVRYSMTETGRIGMSCSSDTRSGPHDDMHLIEATVAMIHHEHVTPAGEKVQALIYTTLLTSHPKLALNLYSGDCAEISTRDCDCFLGEMGMKTHLSGLHSYEKLTGEAVTFAAGQLFDLVESVLPRRFGGYVNDYQLAEEELKNGLPKLSIVVSPRVGPVDEAAVIRTVMENLQATHHHAGGELMSEVWRQADTLRVVRREPNERDGKVAPLRLRPRNAESATTSPVEVG